MERRERTQVARKPRYDRAGRATWLMRSEQFHALGVRGYGDNMAKKESAVTIRGFGVFKRVAGEPDEVHEIDRSLHGGDFLGDIVDFDDPKAIQTSANKLRILRW